MSVALVKEYCEDWGIEVREPSSAYNDSGTWYRGPFHGGIVWEPKILIWPSKLPAGVSVRMRYYTESQKQETDGFYGRVLLHELSHILHGVPPVYAEEIQSEMLAFEHDSAKYFGLGGYEEWYAKLRVSVNGAARLTPWLDLSERCRDLLLASSRKMAIAKQLLTADGTPSFAKRKAS